MSRIPSGVSTFCFPNSNDIKCINKDLGGNTLNLFEKLEIKDDDVANYPDTLARKRNRYIKVDTSSDGSDIQDLHFNLFEQLFISPFVFVDPQGLLNIPTDKSSEGNQIMQLVQYFENVKKLENSSQVSYYFQNIKKVYLDRFLELYKAKKCSEIIYDLFPNGNVGDDFHNVEVEEYLINLDLIDKLQAKELNEFWNNIKETFILAGQEFVLWVDNWEFNDFIKDKVSIRLFANVCNQIKLSVDKNTNVIRYISFS